MRWNNSEAPGWLVGWLVCAAELIWLVFKNIFLMKFKLKKKKFFSTAKWQGAEWRREWHYPCWFLLWWHGNGSDPSSPYHNNLCEAIHLCDSSGKGLGLPLHDKTAFYFILGSVTLGWCFPFLSGVPWEGELWTGSLGMANDSMPSLGQRIPNRNELCCLLQGLLTPRLLGPTSQVLIQ